MPATVHTYTLHGVEPARVRVEADVRQGLPAFALVGLPDAAVSESRERVRAAIVNSGFKFPQRRITANLAPADLRKAGPGFDLALAAAILVATEQLPSDALAGLVLAGELALDGSIRRSRARWRWPRRRFAPAPGRSSSPPRAGPRRRWSTGPG